MCVYFTSRVVFVLVVQHRRLLVTSEADRSLVVEAFQQFGNYRIRLQIVDIIVRFEFGHVHLDFFAAIDDTAIDVVRNIVVKLYGTIGIVTKTRSREIQQGCCHSLEVVPKRHRPVPPAKCRHRLTSYRMLVSTGRAD